MGARRGELTLEAARDAAARPRQPLRARRVAATAKRKKVTILTQHSTVLKH